MVRILQYWKIGNGWPQGKVIVTAPGMAATSAWPMVVESSLLRNNVCLQREHTNVC